MKKLTLWFLEKMATAFTLVAFGALFIVGIAYASGNGLFADVLNKIVSNGNYQTTDGTVLQATKVLGGTATDLYTSNGTTGEWTGATNVKVGDSDKVDGLHASELAGGLSAAGAGGGIYAVTMMLDDGMICPTGYSQFRVNSPMCNTYESNGNISIMCTQYTTTGPRYSSWIYPGQYIHNMINSGYSTVCIKN